MSIVVHVCTRYQNSFYGVDLSNLRESAMEEYFRQPIVVSFPAFDCFLFTLVEDPWKSLSIKRCRILDMLTHD